MMETNRNNFSDVLCQHKMSFDYMAKKTKNKKSYICFYFNMLEHTIFTLLYSNNRGIIGVYSL